MIEKIYDSDCLLEFSDICALKIKVLYKAYGAELPFCSFYAQKDESGRTTAIISKFYTSATVSVNEYFDMVEIVDFLRMISPSEIFSDMSFRKFFCESAKEGFAVAIDCKKSESLNEIPDVNKLKEVHRLFSQGDDDLIVGAFEDWHVDINHRLRHNAAKIFFKENSAALILTDGKNALLNGIATDKQMRLRGEGSRLISNIRASCGAENLFALCSRNLLPFYLKSGFRIMGEYCIINL